VVRISVVCTLASLENTLVMVFVLVYLSLSVAMTSPISPPANLSERNHRKTIRIALKMTINISWFKIRISLVT
jgi:hypothetical protein